MLKLHFAPNSRASRTLWLLEELGLEYELNRMDFHPKDLKSDEHRNRHPLGRVPVLEDGYVSIFESGFENTDVAILQYRYAAQRMTIPMLVRFEVLGMKIHSVQFVFQAQLFQQPQRAAGP